MRPMSRRRTIDPSEPVRTMISPNSSALARRPRALTSSSNAAAPVAGWLPTTPAATCTFCSRIARTTSLAARPREATFAGSSQTRIA